MHCNISGHKVFKIRPNLDTYPPFYPFSRPQVGVTSPDSADFKSSDIERLQINVKGFVSGLLLGRKLFEKHEMVVVEDEEED